MGTKDSKLIQQRKGSQDTIYSHFEYSNADFVQELESDKYGNANLFRLDTGDSIEHFMTVQRMAQQKGEFNVIFREAIRRKLEFACCPYLIQCQNVIKLKQKKYCGNFYKVQAQFEFVSLTLEDEIANKKTAKLAFMEKEIFQVIYDVAVAIQFLQNKGITHQKIQPKTIFISPEGICKLSELSLFIGEESNSEYLSFLYEMNHKCYLSPELLTALLHRQLVPQHNIEKSQVFSLGLCALEMALRQPIQSIYDFNEFIVVQSELDRILNEVKQIYSQELVDVITGMLCLDLSGRWKIKGVINRVQVKDNEKYSSRPTRSKSCIQKSPLYQSERMIMKNNTRIFNQQECMQYQTSLLHTKELQLPSFNCNHQEMSIDNQTQQEEEERQEENILNGISFYKSVIPKISPIPLERQNSEFVRDINPSLAEPFRDNLESRTQHFQSEKQFQQPDIHKGFQDFSQDLVSQSQHNSKKDMNYEKNIELPQPTEKHQAFAFQYQGNDQICQEKKYVNIQHNTQTKEHSDKILQICLQQEQSQQCQYKYGQKQKQFYESHKNCPRDIASLQKTIIPNKFKYLSNKELDLSNNQEDSLQIKKDNLQIQSSSPYSDKYLPTIIAISPLRKATIIQQKDFLNTDDDRLTKETMISTQISAVLSPQNYSEINKKINLKSQSVNFLSPTNHIGLKKQDKMDSCNYISTNTSNHELTNPSGMNLIYDLQDFKLSLKRYETQESCLRDEYDMIHDKINVIELNLISSQKCEQKVLSVVNSSERMSSSQQYFLKQNKIIQKKDPNTTYWGRNFYKKSQEHATSENSINQLIK